MKQVRLSWTDKDSAEMQRSGGSYLEELQQASAGDFIPIYFLFRQVVWMQQFRNQRPKLLFELRGNVWQKQKNKNRFALKSEYSISRVWIFLHKTKGESKTYHRVAPEKQGWWRPSAQGGATRSRRSWWNMNGCVPLLSAAPHVGPLWPKKKKSTQAALYNFMVA